MATWMTVPVSCYFLDIGDAAAVGGLVGEGVAQRGSYGMGGEMLYVGGEMEQLVLVNMVGMDGRDGKLSVGERARLVEDHGAELGEHIHVIGPLDEDALTRGSSDAAEEGERHADDEGARTTDHEEHQGAVNPLNIEH